MAIYVWKGGSSSSSDPNNALDAANWLVGGMTPATPPQPGDSVFIATGTEDIVGPFTIANQQVAFNGTGVVANYTAVTLAASSAVLQSGSALADTLDTIGTFTNLGLIAANSMGGTLTVNEQSLSGGTLVNQGVMEAVNGGSLVVTTAPGTKFANNGFIEAYGGNLTVTATSAGTAGNIGVGSGTAELNEAVSAGQTVVFLDPAGVLKLDQSANFLGRVEGFQFGDTIDLTDVSPTGVSLSYDNTRGLLSVLNAASTVVATLRFFYTGFTLASFSAPTADAAGTGTKITTVNTVVDPNWVAPGNGDWSTAVNWSNVSKPVSTTVAEITKTTSAPYTVTVGTEAVNTLILASAQATVQVNTKLTATRAILDGIGTFSIAAGGTLVAEAYQQTGAGGTLLMGAGSVLTATGSTPTNALNGQSANIFESQGVIAGGTLTASGNNVIAQFGTANVTVSAGGTVRDIYSALGQYSGGVGTLLITGVGTTWSDQGPDTAQPSDAYAGDTNVGGGGYNAAGTLTLGGTGILTVDQQATLTTGHYAHLAYTAGSSGTATIQNGAHWNIGVLLDDGIGNGGSGGTGALRVLSGGVVALGTTELTNTYKMTVGNIAGSTGSETIDGAGSSLDTGGGAMSIGQDGTGSLVVSNGGRVTGGAATPQISWAATVGNHATGVGTLTVTGANSIFAAGGDVLVGRSGTGTVNVANGGTLSAATLDLGGTETAAGGGRGTLALTGGNARVAALHIYAGSTVSVDGTSNLTVGTGLPTDSGQIFVSPGATLDGGGTVLGSVVDQGVVIADQPNQELALDAVFGTGSVQIGFSSALRIGRTSNTVSFNTTNGTLELATPSLFNGTVQNFYATRSILIDGITNAGTSVSGNVVTVSGPGGSTTFTVAGAHPNGFTVTNSGGNTLLTANDPACFCAGTRIATARGLVPVEDIREGDRVATEAGGLRPAVWIGRTTVDLARHPDPKRAAPVRIAAGAFGPGLPARDLRLSPDHAIAIDGVLVPAGLLVNGSTVRHEAARGQVRYFHVELDAHDVLFAEGLPAESYLDTGNRAIFANAGVPTALHPTFECTNAAGACRPFVVAGPRLAAIRKRLASPGASRAA